MSYTNFGHQDEAIARPGNMAMIHDCGTGKTLTALQIAKRDMAMTGKPCLVICPVRLIEEAWLADAKEFMPDLDIVAMYGKNRDKVCYEDHEVYVTSFDTFKNMWGLIKDRGFGVLIIDESSKMKSIKAQITKFILTLAGFKFNKKSGVVFGTATSIPCRHALSATPAPNSPLEYWGQAKLITGPGNQLFNDNFYGFRNKYFFGIPIGLTGACTWRFRTSMFEEFCFRLAKVAHVVRKEDALDLPKQHETIHEIDLSPQEQAAYNSFKKDCILRFKNETVIGANKLSEIMKLRELSSGFMYGEDHTYQIGKTKYQYLKDLLNCNKEQTIVWVNFRQEAKVFRDAMRDSVWIGDCNISKQMEVIKSFKAGKIKYLIANQQSLSHGLTFTNCHYASYLSQNYSYELAKQSKDRLHRIGQTRECFYDHILARGTMDMVVYKANKKKEVTVNNFLKYLVNLQRGTNPSPENCKRIFSESQSELLGREAKKYLKEGS